VIKDDAPGHGVHHDPVQDLRVSLLDFLDFRSNTPRQPYTQVNGTRIPHSTRLFDHRLFRIFRAATPAVGLLSRLRTLREQVPHKIGGAGARVKLYR
jgi:hypothetical protein